MLSRLLLRSRPCRLQCRRSWQTRRSFASIESSVHVCDPSPSELLRFALTSPAGSPPEPDTNAEFRDQILSDLDSQWIGGSPPLSLWGALKGTPSLHPVEARRFLDEIDISSLKRMVEGLSIDPRGPDLLPATHSPPLLLLLRRCLVRNTNREIVSFLSDLAARMQRLELSGSLRLFELGMLFAGLDLSVPALRHFLSHHQELDARQSLEMGPLIIRALSDGLSSALFETPSYDTKPLLSVITGEGDGKLRDRPRLHDKLNLPPWERGLYLCLLARLGSEDVLFNYWSHFVKQLKPRDSKGYHSAYDVVLALLESTRPEAALRFLEDIAKRSQHALPYISTFPCSQLLLKYPGVGKTLPTLIGHDQYKSILDACLRDMERRLGVKWQDANEADGGRHVSIVSGSAWSTFGQRPLLTIDGDCAGYDAPSRLYSELGARGRSKTRRDLGQIVDLLHEHDGSAYNVRPLAPYFRKENGELKSARQSFPAIIFQWRPQHSPVEFSESPLPRLTDLSQPESAVSLGLLRARKIIHGVPRMDAECLHLMQLGYLDVRHSPDQPWESSGYIVTLDRQYGDILALFVGTHQGVINSGPTPVDGPFGPAFALQSTESGGGQGLPVNTYLRDLRGHYYLDVDPSPDLEPGREKQQWS